MTLDDFRGPMRPSGEQLCFKVCPKCGAADWSVYLNPVSGWWLCFRASCGARGRADMGHSAAAVRQLLEDRRRPAGPNTWGPITLPDSELLPPALQRYIEGRWGVLPHQQHAMGMGHWVEANRILIPYFGKDGAAIYWSGRYLGESKDVRKYDTMEGRHPLYVPAWAYGPKLPVDGEIVLVEGCFDAMRVWHDTGKFVVALGGVSLPKYLLPDLLALRPARIRVMLDRDALAPALKLRTRLAQHVDTAEVVLLPPGKDPADSTADELRELLQ